MNDIVWELEICLIPAKTVVSFKKTTLSGA